MGVDPDGKTLTEGQKKAIRDKVLGLKHALPDLTQEGKKDKGDDLRPDIHFMQTRSKRYYIVDTTVIHCNQGQMKRRKMFKIL